MNEVTGSTGVDRYDPFRGFALRVDFLGPPGVGKSTLCEAVMLATPEWVSLRQARALALDNVYKQIPSMPLCRRSKLFLRMMAHGFKQYLWRGIPRSFPETCPIDALRDGAFRAFIKDYHGLVEALSEHWFDPDMALPSRVQRYEEMVQWTRDWLFSLTFCGPVKILADNSRLTRGVSEILSNPDEPRAEEVAKEYIESPLQPSGIIHLVASTALMVERIKQREQSTGGVRNPSHQGLSDAELRVYCQKRLEANERAMAFFHSRKIPFLRIESGEALSDNVRSVQAFLRDLQGARN
jgi:hypothetical protein